MRIFICASDSSVSIVHGTCPDHTVFGCRCVEVDHDICVFSPHNPTSWAALGIRQVPANTITPADWTPPLADAATLDKQLIEQCRHLGFSPKQLRHVDVMLRQKRGASNANTEASCTS